MKKVRFDAFPSRRHVLALGAGFSVGFLAPARAESGADALLTRPIPHSAEPLPVIGLGTVGAFDSGEDPAQRRSLAEVIRVLVEGGGKVVDTAPSYGRAESVVGDLLADTGLKSRVFVATKLEYYDPSTGPAELRASLARLKTDKVDLMQLHNVRDPNQDLGMLREWQAQGFCRYIGITTSSTSAFAAVEAVLRRKKPDFLQVNYSLADREAEKRVIPAAAEVGAAVLTDLPFSRSRLFNAVGGRPVPDWALAFDARSWGQFFLKYLLGNEAVTAVIPGTGNPAHMADNLGAGRGRLPDAAERRKMVEFFSSLG
jgi:aryl-alcohol dehydrogenase-like predicted oxidoreductase